MNLTYKQLELDLWGDLKTVLTKPESADMELLWHSLEDAMVALRTAVGEASRREGIARTDSNSQLLVAGDAISQIVEVYVKRANGILDSLEVTDSSERPVLNEDFLSGRKDLLDLAEKENIPLWQQAIAHWIEQHQGEKVSLWQLQQALGMPLVEVWLGLLHSPTPYQ